MPPLAQSAPINDLIVEDLNGDGHKDMFLVGNDYNTEYETPRLDAGRGFLLLGSGNKNYEVATVSASGIYNSGDARKVKKIMHQGKTMLVVANNNDALGLYKLN